MPFRNNPPRCSDSDPNGMSSVFKINNALDMLRRLQALDRQEKKLLSLRLIRLQSACPSCCSTGRTPLITNEDEDSMRTIGWDEYAMDIEERSTELEADENEEDIDNLEYLNEIAYREWEQEQDIDSNSMEDIEDE
ncbi:5660_t:CDS:2, partial [Ambispora leptoticha]